MKCCRQCRKQKPIEAFNREARSKDGFATICRDCENERARERYHLDPSKQRRASARWIAKDPEHAAESARKAALKYKYANLEKVRAHARLVDAKRRAEDKSGRDAIIHRARAKRRKNKLYVLYESGCAVISKAIKSPTYKGRKKTWEAFGYSPDELRAHLQRQFSPGMNWYNYGHGANKWELDHIKPIASFDPRTVTPEITIRKIFSLKNLRPIWTRDNLGKSSHWNKRYWSLASHD